MGTLRDLQEQIEYINYRRTVDTDIDRLDQLAGDYDRIAQQIVARALTVCVAALGHCDAS